jgi:hypothetical protein
LFVFKVDNGCTNIVPKLCAVSMYIVSFMSIVLSKSVPKF